ncbi:tyrosine-type recombinase/integrase [Aquihabitans sp. G128]|uniref:tyrosine-type recombinase/integrase n=1 Tax=Aquihabitans sp. G128 TaxID=2849779 RepID=UPI001C246CE1|nr:tyrosine-type recombinase/integrase [Aquihabitans sp. G128]QXC61629.1 tyrosine-type recombinase/integrase [Aquihabitans sp. G128]
MAATTEGTAKKRTRKPPIAIIDTYDKPVRVTAPTEGHKYFRASYYLPGDARQKTMDLGKDRAAALEDAQALADQLKSVQRLPHPERKRVTFGELLEDYLRVENHEGDWNVRTSVEKNEDLVRRFVTAEVRAIPVAQLSDADIQSLISDAKRLDETDERPLALSYLKTLRAMLAAIVTWGLDESYFLPGQLTGKYKVPKSAETSVEVAMREGLVDRSERDENGEVPHGESDEDNPEFRVNRLSLPGWDRINQVVACIESTIYQLLVLFGGATGLRFGECAALRWRDIDVHDRTIRVALRVSETNRGHKSIGLPKGGKKRTAAYPAFLQEAVVARVNAAREEEARAVAAAKAAGRELTPEDMLQVGLLFPAPGGGWISRSNFHGRVWMKARKAAGWRAGWTFHTLRHCAAVYMLFDLGIDAIDVAEALGHADVGTTHRIYCQAREGVPRRVAAAMNDTADPWTTPPAGASDSDGSRSPADDSGRISLTERLGCRTVVATVPVCRHPPFRSDG